MSQTRLIFVSNDSMRAQKSLSNGLSNVVASPSARGTVCSAGCPAACTDPQQVRPTNGDSGSSRAAPSRTR